MYKLQENTGVQEDHQAKEEDRRRSSQWQGAVAYKRLALYMYMCIPLICDRNQSRSLMEEKETSVV